MKALLIPSATLIPRDMRVQMGSIPSCLFPLNEITMLQHIFEKYSGYVDKVYVIVGRGKEKVYEYVALKKLPVHIIEVDVIRDLGYTVSYGLGHILKEYPNLTSVYINFADTLISNPPGSLQYDRIYYTREPYAEEWTYFQHNHGVLTCIIDKQHMEHSDEEKGNVFPGVFEIAHAQNFLESFSENCDSKDNPEDSFYRALKQYSIIYPFECVLSGKWFDVGHSDRYFQAKTNVAARVFNTIEIDPERGILTKRSENREKLVDEIKWYLKMPDQLQYLTPRIYDYDLNLDKPYVSMEYYGYNTLHERYVFGSLPETFWRKIFKKIYFVIKDMGRFKVDDDICSQQAALREIYTEKTISRLEKLKSDNNFAPFLDEAIIVNEKKYLSINQYIAQLPDIIEQRLIKHVQSPFCIIHGDLCFSNILVESNLCFLRVIDPRGKFGRYSNYGDQRYELAKLMHSMDGGYDFIIEDMFLVSVEDNRIDLRMPEKGGRVYQIFKEEFCDLLDNYQDLQLIESLLFLSMIPLHSDALNRQYAMLATGVQLLDQAIGGNGI